MVKTEYYGYVRVSTDEQVSAGFSIPQQISAIQMYIESNFHVTLGDDHLFIDDGHSATNLKRPQIQKFIRTIVQDKNPKILVVRHPDRIVRDLLLKRSLQCVFEKYNVKVICLNGSWKEDDSEKDMVADITMLLGENEVKNIPFRVICGYIGSAEIGNYPIGKVPRCYIRVKNHRSGKGKMIVPEENNKLEMVKIFNTLATNQFTLKAMAKYLDKNRVMGMRWNERILINVVDDPIYYGRFKRKWFDSEDPNIPAEKKRFWYSENCHTEPIVSKELWMKVQSVVHHRKSWTLHDYLFGRLVRCKKCGTYVKCESAWKTKRNKKEKVLYLYHTCRHCKKRIGEKAILSAFHETYPDYKMHEIDEKLILALEQKIEKVRKRIEFTNKDYDNNLLDDETYNRFMKSAYQQIKECNEDIIKINASVSEDFNSMTFMQKRALIISCVDYVEVDFDSKNIYINYKEKKEK